MWPSLFVKLRSSLSESALNCLYKDKSEVEDAHTIRRLSSIKLHSRIPKSNSQIDATESGEATTRLAISLLIVDVTNEALPWISYVERLKLTWSCSHEQEGLTGLTEGVLLSKASFTIDCTLQELFFHLKYNFCLLLEILRGNASLQMDPHIEFG